MDGLRIHPRGWICHEPDEGNRQLTTIPLKYLLNEEIEMSHKFQTAARHDEGKHHHRPSVESARATAERDDEETAADRMRTVDRVDGDDGEQPSKGESIEALESIMGGDEGE